MICLEPGRDAHACLYVGQIPSHLANKKDLRKIFDMYGDLFAITVRQKYGVNKSWALLTYVGYGRSALALSPTRGCDYAHHIRVQIVCA